jgi:uncharacterized protein
MKKKEFFMNPNHPNSTQQKANNLLARKPLLAYFVLSYAFFWVFLISIGVVTGAFHIPFTSIPTWVMSAFAIFGSWMPTLAAVIVTGAGEGQEGIKRLLSKFFRFRFGIRWYLAALLPIPLAFLAGGLYRLPGGTAPGNPGLSVGFWSGLIGLNLFQGATGEEAGWRGFALPRLQNRHGAMKASLILGLLWGFWHLPLWLTSGLSGSDLLIYILVFNAAIISLTFLMTWVSNQVPNSLVPVVILHFCFNAGLNLVDTRGLSLGPTVALLAIMAGLQIIIVGIVWLFGRLVNPNKNQPLGQSETG